MNEHVEYNLHISPTSGVLVFILKRLCGLGYPEDNHQLMWDTLGIFRFSEVFALKKLSA